MSRFYELALDSEVKEIERSGFSDPSPDVMDMMWQTTERELSEIRLGKYPIMHRSLMALLERCGLKVGLTDLIPIVEIGPEYGQHARLFREIKAPITYRGYGFSDAIRRYIADRASWISYGIIPWSSPAGALPNDGAKIVIVNGTLSKTPRWREWISEAARVSCEWVLLHRVQFTFLKTCMYRKVSSAPCLEIRLNEAEVIEEIRKHKLKLAHTQMVFQGQTEGCRSYLARKA